MNTNINRVKFLKLIITYIVIGIIAIIIVSAIYSSKEKSLQVDYGKKKLMIVSDWEKEEEARMIRWKQEQRSVCGGSIEGIAKDPDLDIAIMLNEITEQCVPTGSVADVKIEDFTEFNIYITVANQIDRKSASIIVKNILSHCSKYVNSINFIYQDNIVKVIEKQAIDRVKDWEGVNLSTIGEMFITP